VTTTKGTCTGGVIISCSLGTMQVGESVTITLVTTPTKEGQETNIATVQGDLAESTLANNTASAQVLVTTHHVLACTAVIVRPKQLIVGHIQKVHMTIVSDHKVVKGVKVRITGPGIKITTKASDAKGHITQLIRPTRKGIATFRPLAVKSCKVVRVGIAPIIVPVTG
ncbi:MAG TPA: hypothetical protein VNH17_18375, partial [Streptosporangiaceae bacterium]|nr:hypothetical protein [Streptosporangiaceae bacterium]